MNVKTNVGVERPKKRWIYPIYPIGDVKVTIFDFHGMTTLRAQTIPSRWPMWEEFKKND